MGTFASMLFQKALKNDSNLQGAVRIMWPALDAAYVYVANWAFVESRVRPRTSVVEGCLS